MNFIKKIGGLLAKMTSRRKQKLIEAVGSKPKANEDSTSDIEDLIKAEYSQPFQSRSQRMKRTKIKAAAALTPGTPKMKLTPIPLLPSGNLIRPNYDDNAESKTPDQEAVLDVKSGMSLVAETATQMHVSQTQSLGMVTVPSKKTMLAEFYHPMSEIDNKIRQSFDSEHGKYVQFALVPSSDSDDVESVKINDKAARKKELEKANCMMEMSCAEKATRLNTKALIKSENQVLSAVIEKSTSAVKPKREKNETVTKKESVKIQKIPNKKKLTKKETKEKNKTEQVQNDEIITVKERVSKTSLLGKELMPVPPKRVKPVIRTSKLMPFMFNPQKINTNTRVLNITDPFGEIKQAEAKKRVSLVNSKSSLTEFSDSEPESKFDKWQPDKWKVALENIKLMRTFEEAPVDQMGCHKCYDTNVDEKTKRFQVLVALMLSSQTRDQVTYQVMRALREMSCTPISIASMDPQKLMEILHPVAYYKSKTKYLQKTSQILIDQYNSDIPKNVNELIKLPGVGPKMAHLCMAVAWDLITGIGVDTHVHRISNRLGWVPKPTKEPEKTRRQLELWLPSEHWREVNHLLVGFGQTLCTPVRPKCHQCLNNAFCPSANIMQRVCKKEKKNED